MSLTMENAKVALAVIGSVILGFILLFFLVCP